MNEAKVNTNIGDVSSPETKNSTFKCIERAPYELGNLLRRLPRHLHGAHLDAEQLEIIDAADKHASNSTLTLLDGLQSLGRVLWAASANEDFPAKVGDCGRIGTLVTEIALQLEFLIDFREEVMEHSLRIAQDNARKERRA